MADIFHALVLSLHQPPGNLENLLEHAEREAREILYAYDRIPRSLWAYDDIARVHLVLSGALLETLSQPDFQSRVYGIVDCGSLLWYLQNTRIIDILGTAYYHPVLPLIPPADWEEQLQRWLSLGRHLFNRPVFTGCWPPEMGFCMELIPLIKRLGYRYVLVDSEHVEPVTPMSREELCYRPHLAEFGGERIDVVVRDRQLSSAQEQGMDTDWFLGEVRERVAGCDFPPLVTTCSNGENSPWFRDTRAEGNFWTRFYQDFCRKVRAGESPIRPIFIQDYLNRYGAHGQVKVGPGAWNTAWHHGTDFVQWTGSQAQRDALTRVNELSQAVHAALADATGSGSCPAEVFHWLEEARWRVLRAETSCNFFWGEAWVGRCHQDLDEACLCLERASFR